MLHQIPRRFLFALAVLSTTTLTIGHPDDPKGREIRPAYAGPGYRAAHGGVAGLDFQSDGVDLLSWITLPEFGQSWASDCWGYVSPSGREYAIICLSSGTGFVEVTDPEDPAIIAILPGPTSVWRDVKTYQSHAYAVSEGGQGIQVFDLSQIDGGVVQQVNTVTAGGTTSTHNVAINEESGFLYRCGGGGNGLRMYDLSSPAQPQFVASWPDRYVHDAQIVTYADGPYAGREIAFCCSGFNGGSVETGIDILDVTDKDDIQLLARYQHPQGAYSHQAWLSKDRQHLYLNDELEEVTHGFTSRLRIIRVADLENPFQVANYTNGVNAITHNLYVVDDVIFAANYSSGLRVFDVSAPTQPQEVAFFDTAPDNDGLNFSSLWSNYPFFPSGLVIGSSREEGLFVWRVAAVDITFPDGIPDVLDPLGHTIRVRIRPVVGALAPGGVMLHYDAGAGVAGIPMSPLQDGDLFEATLPAFECGTAVSFYVSAEAATGVVFTDPPAAPAAMHVAIAAPDAEDVFTDSFETDEGWAVENSPTLGRGAWVRDAPAGNGERGDPTEDADGSGRCYVTDNVPGANVDSGSTSLISPPMEIPPDGLAFLSYARWHSNGERGHTAVEDSLQVEISNDGGRSWVPIEDVTESLNAWIYRSWSINDFVEPGGSIVVRFTARDFGPGSTVEAAVDDVEVFAYCGPEISPDVNGDGVVDILDLILVIAGWGPCPPDPAPCPGDVDGDGSVDVSDLVEVIGSWS